MMVNFNIFVLLKIYLLQRLLSEDKSKSKEIMQEIQFLKRLSSHPHIVKFISAASVSAAESGHGRDEFLVCTEYCEGIMLLYSRKIRFCFLLGDFRHLTETIVNIVNKICRFSTANIVELFLLQNLHKVQ